MNIALFNSFVIYKRINSNKQIKNYLLSFARAWLTMEVDEIQPTTSRATDPTDRLSGDMKKHT